MRFIIEYFSLGERLERDAALYYLIYYCLLNENPVNKRTCFVSNFVLRSFEFVSNFEFRISDLKQRYFEFPKVSPGVSDFGCGLGRAKLQFSKP